MRPKGVLSGTEVARLVRDLPGELRQSQDCSSHANGENYLTPAEPISYLTAGRSRKDHQPAPDADHRRGRECVQPLRLEYKGSEAQIDDIPRVEDAPGDAGKKDQCPFAR